MQSLDCPPGYVLAQAPQESNYETCLCNYNNTLILQCDGMTILIEVFVNLRVVSIFMEFVMVLCNTLHMHKHIHTYTDGLLGYTRP